MRVRNFGHPAAKSNATTLSAVLGSLMRRTAHVISMGLAVLAISAAARADNVDGAPGLLSTIGL